MFYHFVADFVKSYEDYLKIPMFFNKLLENY
jgi:hypothetical protein